MLSIGQAGSLQASALLAPQRKWFLASWVMSMDTSRLFCSPTLLSLLVGKRLVQIADWRSLANISQLDRVRHYQCVALTSLFELTMI